MDTIEKAASFVAGLFDRKREDHLVFHNLGHTIQVVRAVEMIAHAYRIAAQDHEILLLAAWFHDCGYLFRYSSHEDESIRIARSFLKNENYPPGLLEGVLGCIDATRLPQVPKDLLEMILCDADMSHLAAESYPWQLRKLRREWGYKLNKHYTDESWKELNIAFLSEHRYFTNYCREKLEPKKQKNLRLLSGHQL